MRSTQRFDVLIVGGGSAGCVLARRLAERGDRTVGLLEAGPDLRAHTPPMLRNGWSLPSGPDWPDWGYESAPDAAGASSKLRRGRLMGGNSWLTRYAVRGAASDYDGWAAAGNAGWRFEDVLPAFRRAETDLEFGNGPWHGDEGPVPITRYPERHVGEIHARAVGAFGQLGHPLIEDANAPDAVGIARMPMSAREGRRVTTLDAYLPLDWSPPTLTVRPGSPVDRVLVERGRAAGVRLVDGIDVLADRVILSAGVYGSPSILLRSGIGPAAELGSLGIPVALDLPGVGANLADHPAVELDSGSRGATDGPSLSSIARYRSSFASASDSPDLMVWLQDPSADDPVFWLDAILLRPRSRGKVRLRSADPAVALHIELPGVRDPMDADGLVEGYRRGIELANRLAEGSGSRVTPPADLGSTAEARAFVTENAYSIPHTVGTCAMGPSAADGAVVDAQGRVHGIEGLEVVDASIIPEPPSGFTHLITIMIAEHLASKEDRS